MGTTAVAASCRKNPTPTLPEDGEGEGSAANTSSFRRKISPPIMPTYRKAMDALYLACVLVAGSALVLISAVIP